MSYTYRITGTYSYNDADTESGYADVEVDEVIAVDDLGCEAALDGFLATLETDEDFVLKTCDAETYGKKGATFVSRFNDSDNTIDVDLVDD